MADIAPVQNAIHATATPVPNLAVRADNNDDDNKSGGTPRVPNWQTLPSVFSIEQGPTAGPTAPSVDANLTPKATGQASRSGKAVASNDTKSGKDAKETDNSSDSASASGSFKAKATASGSGSGSESGSESGSSQSGASSGSSGAGTLTVSKCAVGILGLSIVVNLLAA